MFFWQGQQGKVHCIWLYPETRPYTSLGSDSGTTEGDAARHFA